MSAVSLHSGPWLLMGLVLTFSGCSSAAVVPPANPPPLQDELLEDLSFAINAQDPLVTDMTIAARMSTRITASYRRRGDPAADWELINLLVLQDDAREYPGGIRASSVLGLRADEKPGSRGVAAFECRSHDGSTGKVFTFPSSPGRYEIRLCWVRQPKSVAEKIAQSEDPHQFMTPFYRAYLTIAPPSEE